MYLRNLILLSIAFTLTLFTACTDDATDQEETLRVVSTGNPTIDGLTAKIIAHPKDHKLYAQRAAAYFEMEGYDEAIADMADALRLDSNNVSYHYLLSDVYLEYYKSNQALLTMERAVALEPENITSLLKLAQLQLFLKQNKNSLQTINSILEINKNNAEAYVLMGANFEQMGDEAKAINSYQTAIENNPNLADIHMKLGQIFAAKQNKLAIRYFDNAIAVEPENVMLLYAKAEYLHNNDQLDEALEVLKEAVIKDHQFTDAIFRSGIIYIEKDSLEKAYNQFDLVIKNDPASVKGFYYRGLSSELNGKPAQAKTDYEQALALAPEYQKAKEALSRLQNR